MRKLIGFGKRGLGLWAPILWLMVVLCPWQQAFAEEGWWNEDWQYRKKISFDTTSSGGDVQSNLSDVRMLVRLHSGNMNFTHAREDGGDLRFVAPDDKTLLNFHLEQFDGLEELAVVWVRIPKLSGASNQDFVWMYYGNNEAAGGQEQRKTFGNSAAVFHFSETQGMPENRSEMEVSVREFSGGQGLPGVIGNGLSLNGLNDRMILESSPSLDMQNGFTVSAWVRIPTFLEDAVLFQRMGDTAAFIMGIDQANLYAEITLPDGQTIITEKTAALSPGSWHPVAVTASAEGLVTVFVDGIKIDWVNLNRRLPKLNGAMSFGASLVGERFFTGELDEVRIYPSVVSADMIRLDFANQGPDRACVTLGLEMVYEGGGLPIFYLGTVFKNITLDGWLIILILLGLGVMSWAVILTKGITFYITSKENRQFRDAVNDEHAALFTADVSEFETSSLSRIYTVASNVFKHLFGDGEEKTSLSSKDLDHFKSELEKGLIDETVRMNTWMTVLTMSISGGPFLGLLGTVWGVMNTFAAMAEAGEANIMAIAPGVASALSTTVFGLIVAIPALFGYNYLSTRIRQMTIDLNIYVDELGLLVDRTLGGER